MIRDKVSKLLEQAISKTGIDDSAIALTHPANPEHGDFSTSIALKHAKKRGVPPMELAEQIAKNIDKGDLVEKVEVLKPGFINIFLTTKSLTDEMGKINTNYGKLSGESKNIIIEYGQPNTHKMPHIGHLFSYIFGESLARILEINGHKLIRTNYQGDIGPHVAKCLWYIQKNPEEINNTTPLREKIETLQKAYQEGSHAYENDPAAQEHIDNINRALYGGLDNELNELWTTTRSLCVEYYDQFQKALGIHYDRLYFESETWKAGKKIVESNTGKVFEKSEGAIVFKGEQYKLHTRVFINKFGIPTYEGKDLGLMMLKKSEYDFDLSLVTTAVEQNEYWKVVKKAGELVFPDLVGKMHHLGFGMINLITGKMSSRTGKIVGAFQLVDLTREAIAAAFPTDDATLTEKITLAAIKYSFLKSDPQKNISFNLETSIAREGDSGPYLLYTFARTNSIFQKAGIDKSSLNDVTGGELNPEEKTIVRLLSQFPEVVEAAAAQYAPSLIATYLFTLAQSYNLFYQKHQIIKAEEAQKALRLALTSKVGIVLKTGLNLLGIETVDKM